MQNIKSTSYKDKQFDVAVGLGVLMYLNQRELHDALKELARLSKYMILVDYNTQYFNDAQTELFIHANDGRYDHDYVEECRAAGLNVLQANRCEQFWDPEINLLNELGLSLVVAK